MVDVTGGSNYTVDRVWPYAQRQHAQADVMLHRLQAWQAIIGGLTAYFDGERACQLIKDMGRP